MLDFHTLEMRYGAPIAYALLCEIEKATRLKSSELAAFDPEARLANALRIQDAMHRCAPGLTQAA